VATENEQNSQFSPLNYEQVLRRFPSVSTQESMTSPVSPIRPTYEPPQRKQFYPDLPSPPTRPPPTVPRPSYIGLSHGADEDGVSADTNKTLVKVKKGTTVDAPGTIKYYAGLNNPGNWCYANSSLQALRVSPGFGTELADAVWQELYKVPKKQDEKIEHPQLMSRMMANLFQWMASGNIRVMKAQTLMVSFESRSMARAGVLMRLQDYSRHVAKKLDVGTPNRGRIAEFGGPQQQDAEEFLIFLFDNLQDETNIRRNAVGNPEQTRVHSGRELQAAHDYWEGYLQYKRSIIEKYFAGLQVTKNVCNTCKNATYNWEAFNILKLNLKGGEKSLGDCLNNFSASETIDDFDCDSEYCKARKKTTSMTRQTYLARLPPLLCIQMARFEMNHKNNELRKIKSRVSWNFSDLDLDAHFIPPANRTLTLRVDDPAFVGPFNYDCYAVVCHAGNSIQSGHYFAYVQNPHATSPHDWYQCNDSVVQSRRIGAGPNDIQEDVFLNKGDNVPYLLFFKRKS